VVGLALLAGVGFLMWNLSLARTTGPASWLGFVGLGLWLSLLGALAIAAGGLLQLARR
jgi:hypothetical protein